MTLLALTTSIAYCMQDTAVNIWREIQELFINDVIFSWLKMQASFPFKIVDVLSEQAIFVKMFGIMGLMSIVWWKRDNCKDPVICTVLSTLPPPPPGNIHVFSKFPPKSKDIGYRYISFKFSGYNRDILSLFWPWYMIWYISQSWGYIYKSGYCLRPARAEMYTSSVSQYIQHWFLKNSYDVNFPCV